MGKIVPDNWKTNEDDETKILEGEHKTAQNFHILYRVGLETFLQREAVENEVTPNNVCDAMYASPTTNRILDQLPYLIAQAYLAQKRCREEVEREERS